MIIGLSELGDDIDTSRTWRPSTPADPAAVRLVLVSECAASDPADD